MQLANQRHVGVSGGLGSRNNSVPGKSMNFFERQMYYQQKRDNEIKNQQLIKQD